LSLTVENQGFPDVVIWNPWVELCAQLKDMPVDGWKHMLCVEAAAAQHPVNLPAGEEWYGRQTLVVA
jgi:glucose-6-phosphate 1-epimerase